MFFEEAQELLQALESGLMDLEARQGDREYLDRVFRAAHTLKGAAGMVGLASIAEFTHRVEAILDRIRGDTLRVHSTLISTLLEARDHLAAAIDAQAEGRVVPAPANLVSRLEALVQETSQQGPPQEALSTPQPLAAPAPGEAVSQTLRFYRITLNPQRDLLRRGVNPLGILDELRELGELRVAARSEQVPPLEDLEPSDCYISWTMELRSGAELGKVEEVFLFLDDPSQFHVVEIPPWTEPDADSAPARTLTDAPADPEPDVATSQQPASTAPPSEPATTKTTASSRIRVDADELDHLVGMAGELAILTDSLQGIRELPGADAWSATLEALERLGGRLRETTLELRMVPVQELFGRFPRVVRDLADRSGKRIALRIEGEETRLDRTIVERLADPMIHLIRNAVDHGLESPSEREAAGKPVQGRVTIAAGYEGDRVEIRIEDDGRGLDRTRILRKGIAKGLLPPETSVDDPRVGTLIFEAGFSTRDQVGELSGRGVGLDVVRDTIRALRGSVTLRSQQGSGTVFAISLPLTLAMIDGLLVEVDGGRYVVPMGQVDECVALAPDDSAWALRGRAMTLRGEFVPVVSLREAFVANQTAHNHRELLLTRYAGQRVGVAVDRLLGRVQAVIQPLDEGLGGLRRFSGATILGDGCVCLIVDLSTVVAEARAAELRAQTVLLT
jgi:two-component system chemotaxis sensor kinase CheA